MLEVDHREALAKLGVKDENKDVMDFKGTDWKNMSVLDWFHFAKANKTFKEPGISYDELYALYLALMSKKGAPLNILETGQCLGTTTRFFLIYTLKYGGKHNSMEFKVRPLFKEAMTTLGLWDKFNTIEGDAQKVHWDKPIDFLFIDSEHCITDALGEYMKYRVFLTGDSIVGFHDTDTCYGVRRTIEFIRSEIDDLEPLSNSNNRASAGIEFFRLKGRGEVAARVNKAYRDKETEKLIEARKAQEAALRGAK